MELMCKFKDGEGADGDNTFKYLVTRGDSGRSVSLHPQLGSEPFLAVDQIKSMSIMSKLQQGPIAGAQGDESAFNMRELYEMKSVCDSARTPLGSITTNHTENINMSVHIKLSMHTKLFMDTNNMSYTLIIGHTLSSDIFLEMISIEPELASKPTATGEYTIVWLLR
jgi:hypothetical protein